MGSTLAPIVACLLCTAVPALPAQTARSGIDSAWTGADDGASGRRRRARGRRGSSVELDAENLADREDIVAVAVAPVSRLVSLADRHLRRAARPRPGARRVHRPEVVRVMIFGVQVLFVVSVDGRDPAAGPACRRRGRAARRRRSRPRGRAGRSTRRSRRSATSRRRVRGRGGRPAAPPGRPGPGTREPRRDADDGRRRGGVRDPDRAVPRQPLGSESIAACLTAATVAIVVARAARRRASRSRAPPHRWRAGRSASSRARWRARSQPRSSRPASRGCTRRTRVIAGLITAVAAVLADLGVGYAEASREIEGEVSSLWIVRHMQGPLGAFALAAPVAYAMSVMVLE